MWNRSGFLKLSDVQNIETGEHELTVRGGQVLSSVVGSNAQVSLVARVLRQIAWVGVQNSK